MPLDAYSPCPCGSGKKFKWCCQPIHEQLAEAFEQDQQGQHEAALRLMDQVCAQHADNPEVWGRKAQLLYQNGQLDQAEEALDKAFQLNPDYPFGHFLRARFRQQEGELPGALALFRKAGEVYDPAAMDILAEIYTAIAECELQLNRPIAARAALQQAIRCNPGYADLRESLDTIFGEKSRLPEAARREYAFQPLRSASPEGGRGRWTEILQKAGSGRLIDALNAFQRITSESSDDPAAWYNLALAQAWLGRNAEALEALDQYVMREPDEERAIQAWTLGEVLRCGAGMEEHADYVEHSAIYRIRSPEDLVPVLQGWESDRRLLGVKQHEEQAMLTGLVLERLPEFTPALAATQVPGLGAYLLIFADRLRLWHTSVQRLHDIREEVRQRAGPGVAEEQTRQGPVAFNDVLAEGLGFPVHMTDPQEAALRAQEYLQRYLEETWARKPLHSLNLIPPVDAAGHPILRKKLLGVIRFLEQCSARFEAYAADFERLRRKLGLAPTSTTEAGVPPESMNTEAMSPAELSRLDVATLSTDQVEQAYHSALKADAQDLASHFARVLVERPPSGEHRDRYPVYSHLVQAAIAEGDTTKALDYLNEGERADCEQNDGRRRNDYELRRAQLHAKRGEIEPAVGIFERLIARLPDELRYRGSAAEAMLSANEPARALRFAQEGLARANQRNDRDLAGYLQELVNAAQKRMR